MNPLYDPPRAQHIRHDCNVIQLLTNELQEQYWGQNEFQAKLMSGMMTMLYQIKTKLQPIDTAIPMAHPSFELNTKISIHYFDGAIDGDKPDSWICNPYFDGTINGGKLDYWISNLKAYFKT